MDQAAWFSRSSEYIVDEFDVVAIGSGTGGYSAAIRARQLGLTAAIVEKEKIGGTCLHKGCIPTKVWLETAETMARVLRAGDFGVRAEGVSLDFSKLVARQHEVVDTIHKSLSSVIQNKHKIEVIQGEAHFRSSSEIAVGDRLIKARHIVIATGSKPKQIPGLEPDGTRILDSDHVLKIESPPQSIAIIGGGAVGSEFASFFTDIGTEVTLIEMMPTIVPLEDADLGKALGRSLASRGAAVLTSASVIPDRTRTYDGKVELTVAYEGEEKRVTADAVLVAVGREAVVDVIGLENTAVEMDGGFIKIDDSYHTDDPSIWAVGDAIGNLLLAHVAGAEGMIAAEAIAGEGPEPLDYNRVPRVTYTRPQVASVGMTVDQAKDAGRHAKSQRISLRTNAMALIHGETDGIAKVVFDRESGDLLGVHLFGPNVSELIAEAALGRFLEASAWELGTSIHPHPTLSEALGEAAQLSVGIGIYR
ncbi:MAG: dihydrolipoyl dehydrogenase [Chloroflexi bacterium]|nr:dihydrolipoyl dehydrogenase [Chloroflexota bacterium]